MAKILVVDDDVALAKELGIALRSKNYLVDTANSGLDARAYLSASSYDLIVLDWELPDTTGVELCRQIRSGDEKSVPVLFLTARSHIEDKAEGYHSGADDYLTKPFHMSELLLRVNALFRRSPVLKNKEIKIRDLVLNVDGRRVYKGGEEIVLLPKEFALLEFFMSHPGQVYTNEQLLRHVWPTESDSSPETLRVTLMRVRQKLAFPEDAPLILTLRGVGYRLEP